MKKRMVMTMKKYQKKITGLVAAAILSVCILILIAVPVMAEPQGSGTCGTCTWTVEDGVLTISPTNGVSGTLDGFNSSSNMPWYRFVKGITTVTVMPGVKTSSNAAYLFCNLNNCTNFNVENLDVSNAKTFNRMFQNCKSITDTHMVAQWNTSNVNSMTYMFSNCDKLTNTSGLAQWDTSGLVDMDAMFSECTQLNDISGIAQWDTSRVTFMSSLFSECSQLNDISGIAQWDTSRVTSMSSLFKECSQLNDISGLAHWDTSNVTNMSSMFSSCSNLTNTNGLAQWDTSNVRNMGSMFSGCSNLTNTNGLAQWDTSNVTSMSSMFSSCSNLTNTDGLAQWDTSNVTNMSSMFSGCKNLTNTNGLAQWDTSNVTNVSSMFSYCKLTNTNDLAQWDTSNVTNMRSMFDFCSKLTNTNGLAQWDTSNVTNMSSMFSGCSNLTNTNGLAQWDTSNVTNMSSMFTSCKNLTNTNDLAQWDTSNVTNMRAMFYVCSNLTNTNGLAQWDTSNVTNMDSMFYSCSNLTNTNGLAQWDTSNVEDMSCLFYRCENLQNVDSIAHWNTSKNRNVRLMFDSTGVRSVNMMNWDLSKVNNYERIFRNCSSLSSITFPPSFKPSDFSSINMPSPPDNDYYTGKWIREDRTYGPYTVSELASSYDPNTMSGTWIWEIKENYSFVNFDSNGGGSNPDSIVQNNDFSPISFPSVSRPGYRLLGWNLNVDGSGEKTYEPGLDPDNAYTPQSGRSVTFYAQWVKVSSYKVEHYKQNVSFDGYSLVETLNLSADAGIEITPAVNEYDGFILPAPQTVVVPDNDSLVIRYEYDRTRFTVHFDGNGADSGTVSDQAFVGDVSQKLNVNLFKKADSVFYGWNTAADGTGTAYTDTQSVKNLVGNNETCTLYAQWLDLNSATVISQSEGTFRVKLKAGQTFIIPNLPDGTEYSISEVNQPDGWDQVGEQNTNGTIAANETREAWIKNNYDPEDATASIKAYKKFEGGEVEPGQYTFALMLDGNEISRQTNGSIDREEKILGPDGQTMIDNPYYGLSVVRFEEIPFDEEAESTLTIVEIPSDDPAIEYDSHEETVTVKVTDNKKGSLVAKVIYDEDGPIFTNKLIPVVSKEKFNDVTVSNVVLNKTSDADFEFPLTLTDDAGTELTDSYTVDILSTDDLEDYRKSLEDGIDPEEAIQTYGVTRKTFKSGDTLILKDGQTALLHDIPVGTSYSAVNGDTPNGYELISTTGANDTITEDGIFEAVFTHVYSASGRAELSLTKTFTGGTIEENQFFFDLVDSSDTENVLQTSSAAVDGTVSFILDYSYEDAGQTFHYTIMEKAGEDEEIIYDKHTVDVAVSVTDNDDGTLDTEVTYTGEKTFTNVYNTVDLVLEADKTFLYGDLTEKSFTFELLDNGTEVGRATTDTTGHVSFEPITYHVADIGEHIYTIKEVIGSDPIEWDTHEETVKVTVSKNADETLKAVATYDSDGAVFENQAYALKDITVTKKVTGNMGDKSKEFSFVMKLTMPSGVERPQSIACALNGEDTTIPLTNGQYKFSLSHEDTIVFKDIPATTQYRITEDNGMFSDYTVTSQNANGTLTDDVIVSFVNHRDVSVPTSADVNSPLMLSLMCIAALGIVAGFIYRRKRSR